MSMDELREALRIQAIGAADLVGLIEAASADDEAGMKEVVEGVTSRNDVTLIPALLIFLKSSISKSPSLMLCAMSATKHILVTFDAEAVLFGSSNLVDLFESCLEQDGGEAKAHWTFIIRWLMARLKDCPGKRRLGIGLRLVGLLHAAAKKGAEDEVFGGLLVLLRPSPGNQAYKSVVLVMALANLLGQLVRERPEARLPAAVPTLLELFERAPRMTSLFAGERQCQNLEHTLRLQLGSLLGALSEDEAIGAAFTPLIMDALGKQKRVPSAVRPTYGSKRATATTEAKAPSTAIEEQAQEEERFAKRMKPSAAFADEADDGHFNCTTLSLPMVISTLLKTLRRVDPMALPSRVEAWRPSKPVQSDALSAPAFEDPRKRAAMGKQVKFSLIPVEMDPMEVEAFVGQALVRVLQAGQAQDLDIGRQFGRRKDWALLVARLASLVDASVAEGLLLDYCFVDLPVRAGLVLLWLRHQWLLLDDGAAYEAVITRLLQRFHVNADVDEWGRLLVEAPGLLSTPLAGFFGDAFASEEGDKKPFGDLLARLVLERQSVRHELADQVIEPFSIHPAEAVRKAIFEVVGKTCDRLGGSYVNFVQGHLEQLSDDAERDPAVYLGLAMEMLGKRPAAVIPKLLDAHEAMAERAKEQLNLSLGATIKQIAEGDEYTLFIQALVESVPRDSPLIARLLEMIPGCPAELASALLLQQANPGLITAVNGKVGDADLALAMLPALISSCSVDALGQTLARLVQSPVDPVRVFASLHTINGVPLKRCLEATQACFAQPAIWKAPILSAALDMLLAELESSGGDATALPTLFMRSLLQAVTLYPGALGPWALATLSRLVPRRVWESPRAWEGYLRAAKHLLPGSVSAVIVQLPIQQVRALLEAVPEARAPLKEYLWAQPPSLRARFAPLISLFD
jgi:hypothetical protein